MNVSKGVMFSTFRWLGKSRLVRASQAISSLIKNDLTTASTNFTVNSLQNRCLGPQILMQRRYVSDLKEDRAEIDQVRLSKLISSCGTNMQMSRKSAEILIKSGRVTVLGSAVTDPNEFIHISNAVGNVKVAGKLLLLDVMQQKSEIHPATANGYHEQITEKTFVASKRIRVWIANKLPGELVSENDPHGRPSLLERLQRGGVGRSRSSKSQKVHLKAVGRLDMMTEGLVLITNDGGFARELELPKNKIHRTYRVRVHGLITPQKLNALRKGVNIDGMFYKGMKVNLETVRDNRIHGAGNRQSEQRVKGGNTNSWLRITCIEGKNRQIRKTLEHVGLKVTRLIRTSFGDYDLNTIPSGMAIEVPYKSLEQQKRRGQLEIGLSNIKGKTIAPSNKFIQKSSQNINEIQPIQWVRH